MLWDGKVDLLAAFNENDVTSNLADSDPPILLKGTHRIRA